MQLRITKQEEPRLKEVKEIEKQIAARCRGKLAEKRIRLNSVAEMIGVSEPTIYSKMNGVSNLTVGELSIIAAMCNFTRDDVNFVIFGR